MSELMGRRALVVANWKMNGQMAGVEALTTALRDGLDLSLAIEVVLCPPFVYLARVQELLSGSSLGLGAQTLCRESSGAFTGEVSASMLKDFGCSHVLVGHSERRSLFGEDDGLVAGKFQAAIQNGLVPILCVGETAEERAAGHTAVVVGRQLAAVLDTTGAAVFAEAVVAYEPVWAIGSGQAATPQVAQEVHAMIRALLAARSREAAQLTRILYGGSVTSANAAGFYAEPDIDGALVGGASLVAEDFIALCAGIARTSKQDRD